MVDLLDQVPTLHGIRDVAVGLCARLDAIDEVARLVPEAEPVIGIFAGTLREATGIENLRLPVVRHDRALAFSIDVGADVLAVDFSFKDAGSRGAVGDSRAAG